MWNIWICLRNYVKYYANISEDFSGCTHRYGNYTKYSQIKWTTLTIMIWRLFLALYRAFRLLDTYVIDATSVWNSVLLLLIIITLLFVLKPTIYSICFLYFFLQLCCQLMTFLHWSATIMLLADVCYCLIEWFEGNWRTG